ncbi:MAG: MarR family winged helix-turn-helix transcriptional regulator [Acidimicrobiales bacterium]
MKYLAAVHRSLTPVSPSLSSSYISSAEPSPSRRPVADESQSRPAGNLDEVDRLHVVLFRLGRQLRAIDAGTGLTPAELSALGTAVRIGPIRPSELARREGINPATLSRLMARLVDEGALCREDDPADGRGALVSVTAHGRRLHQQLRVARARALCEHVASLSDSQQRAISTAIPALEALIEVMDGSAR